MWTKRPFPLKDNLFFYLCGKMLYTLYKVRHPAVDATINMGYQVRWEVCAAIADEVATLNAGCGTKKKGGGA
jgi:hypothetical protein